MQSSLPTEIDSWLRTFSRAVRERNFDAGKRLFDQDVVSFGTVCFRVEGLDELASKQWNTVWPNTRDFEFEYNSARALMEPNHAVVLSGWKSTGLGSGGAQYARRGRATIILHRASSLWKAVHTHFSLSPLQKNDPLLRQAI